MQHYPNNSKRFNNTLSTKTKLHVLYYQMINWELNIRLHEALQYAQPVEVKFYNNGFVDSVRLTIYRIDAINYEIDGYVYNQQQRQKFLSLIS